MSTLLIIAKQDDQEIESMTLQFASLEQLLSSYHAAIESARSRWGGYQEDGLDPQTAEFINEIREKSE